LLAGELDTGLFMGAFAKKPLSTLISYKKFELIVSYCVCSERFGSEFHRC